MKTVEVRNQVHLPLVRCVELVLNGVRFRLFRAAVTVAIISLAVAFLTTMITESLVTRDVADAIKARTAPRRQLLFWVGRMSVPMTDKDLMDQLALAGTDSPRRAEFQTWGQLSDEQVDALRSVAVRQRVYLAFFDEELNEGDRTVILSRTRGNDVFGKLQSEEALVEFHKRLQQRGKQLPTSAEDFQTFLTDWKAAREPWQQVLAGHHKALADLGALLAGRRPTQALAEGDSQFAEQIEALGYRIGPEQLDQVREQAQLSLDADRIWRTLGLSVVKQRLASRIGQKISEINPKVFFSAIRSSGGSKWLVEQMEEQNSKLREALEARSGDQSASKEQTALLASREAIEQFTLTAERIQEVANSRLEQAKLAEVEASVAQTGSGSGFLGFSPRTMWLILVSFLVCIVGITNAMLMSVTERFNEIATMKCLGATDGFIMVNFILESCLQGTAGGVIGAMLGLLLGALRSWVDHGAIAIVNFPVGPALLVAGLSLVIGVIISALAAVYPAWVAARLAPMEAMRIE
jgi:FtsX-like permease family protein